MSPRDLIFRLPLHLERLGLRLPQRLITWLLGVEWIVLETTGRRSGRVHTVVLDVVGRDVQRGIYYMQPAEGRRSQWVRNVLADPHVTLRVGTKKLPARVRDASGAEGAEVVLRFLRAHPIYGRVIARAVGYVDRVGRPDDELRRDLIATPVFAIEPLRSTS